MKFEMDLKETEGGNEKITISRGKGVGYIAERFRLTGHKNATLKFENKLKPSHGIINLLS